jgi:hypothetical protein
VKVRGIYTGVTLSAQIHHVSHGQKFSVLGGVGHMASETIFRSRRVSLCSEERILLVTLKTESLGWSIQQGLGVSGVCRVTVQAFFSLVHRRMDGWLLKLIYLLCMTHQTEPLA